MKTIVTGAAGYIGSHLSKRLEADGHDLILIDDFSRGQQRYLDWLGVKTKVTKMDLRIYDNMFECFKGADVVYHIASKIGGNQFLHGSALNELSAFQNNSSIDTSTFRACVEHDIKKVIYTSSISIYNTAMQSAPNAYFSEKSLEKQPLDPEGGYGWAKYLGEWQLSQMPMKTGIARIFKSFGPCDDYSEESGQVVCSLMRKAINYPKEKYVVWGDGSVSRCLVYIDDLIDALLKIEKYIDKESLIVNIGGNRPIPISELAERILDIAAIPAHVLYDTDKPVGVKSRIPDLKLAKEKLNWEPTTSLDEGLRKTYQWMKEDLDD